MRLRKGKETVGMFKGVPLTLNWDYLFKEHGLRRETETAEKALSRLLMAVLLLTLGSLLAYDFLQGRFLPFEVLNPDRIADAVFWGECCCICMQCFSDATVHCLSILCD
ncbi:MAG: hypothetical protein TR69_WS6001000813 [candidate division WS6 bacterium OLB20]|uniref:Uncharacterized protein n=1 Tax=candidate division WS6 bacterium OLB20 TaxID=1617426 RepID=A0A136LYP8_9BACT|nr:MAG: hypothetical protein TR69_WS6001000813 [candidate division WS6 bacterium OLB20]